MDKKTLVNIDVEAGKKFLEKLDQSDLQISNAFWMYLEDVEEWSLFLVTPYIESEGPLKAYKRIQQFIEENKQEISIPLEAISLIGPHHELNKLLRSVIKTGPRISGIRFSGNVINGVLIKDAYLYRIN